jgi:Secretion system C-terminal sorting domain
MPFPNPVSPGMTLQIPFVNERAEIQLYNLQGKLMLKQDLPFENTITIASDTPVGSYLLRVVSEKQYLKFLVDIK